MNRNISILLHDDWELRGDGVGDVADLQYLPMRMYLRVAREHGIRLTFMADAMQQLCFLRYAGQSREVDLQARIWEEAILLAKEAGHDIQLHIHPQWYRATYSNQVFHPVGSWDISAYPGEDRKEMLSGSISYLRDLLQQADASHTIIGFKAGGWALRSSPGILKELQSLGIRLVMGPGKAYRLRGSDFNADYSEMEEDTLPYLADLEDPCRVAAEGTSEIIVLPMPFYEKRFLRKIADRILRRSAPRHREISEATERMFFYWPRQPVNGVSRPPQTFWDNWRPANRLDRWLSRGKRRSLDISLGDFHALKTALDAIMARYRDLPEEKVILPLQSHSKTFRYNPSVIEKFFGYLLQSYGDEIEFLTLSDIWRNLSDYPVRMR